MPPPASALTAPLTAPTAPRADVRPSWARLVRVSGRSDCRLPGEHEGEAWKLGAGVGALGRRSKRVDYDPILGAHFSSKQNQKQESPTGISVFFNYH